jgi:hypothetical protein
MRRLLRTAVGAVVALGLYMILIDNVSSPELYAMAAIVLLAGLAYAASLEQGFAEAVIRPRWLLTVWRPVLSVPRHLAQVTMEAMAQIFHRRSSRGQFRAVSYAGGESQQDIGRCALSEALGSLAPNTIVIGVDTERQLLLVHQLHRSGGAEELDVLRLG